MKAQLQIDFDKILNTPFDDLPTIEEGEHTIEFPLKRLVGRPMLFDFFVDSLPEWGVQSMNSSLPKGGILQTDVLILGIGVHFHLDPTTFLVRGTYDGYEAAVDWSAPWRAVYEIIQNYRFRWIHQQRYMLLDCRLDEVAYINVGKKEEKPVDEVTARVVIAPYVNRLNQTLERLQLDSFQTKEIDAPLALLDDRYPLGYSRWRKLQSPIVLDKGNPLAVQLVSDGDEDWTEHAVLQKTVVDLERRYSIPAGSFKITFGLKGAELWGEPRKEIMRALEPKCPWLVGL